MANEDQRIHAQSLMKWLLTNHEKIGYIPLRPMATTGLYEQQLQNAFALDRIVPPTKVISPDCSETVTMICRMSGMRDPSGPSFDYNGYGNSNTMWNYLPRFTNPSSAHLGTIVTFGKTGEIHVAMVMEEPVTNDPLLFSHGSAGGPISIRLSEYLAAEPQQAPATFLAISGI